MRTSLQMDEQHLVRKFDQEIQKESIEAYGQGRSLTQLIALAEICFRKIYQVSRRESTAQGWVEVLDVQFQKILLKRMLIPISHAIQFKRDYYDQTWMGTVKKILMYLLGSWNGGMTLSIQMAKDFQDRVVAQIALSNDDKDQRYIHELLDQELILPIVDIEHPRLVFSI